jgi:CHAD domain-containing protein
VTKALPIPDVAADTPIGAFAARVIETRAAEVDAVLGEQAGNGTAESVHDRRVAIRRLRTALEVFEPELPKKARGVRRDLKGAFSALGPRRDADVALELVRGLEPSLATADLPGWRGVVAALESRREASGGALDIAAAQRARADAAALAARADGHGGVVAAKAMRKIAGRRLREVREGLVVLDNSGDADALHGLRIAAKRLRYVLEAAEPALGDAAADGAKAARDVQTLLGDVHDCDVLLPWLRAHRRDLRSDDVAAARAGRRPPNASRYRGVQTVDTHLRARRQALVEEVAGRREALGIELDRVAAELSL